MRGAPPVYRLSFVVCRLSFVLCRESASRASRTSRASRNPRDKTTQRAERCGNAAAAGRDVRGAPRRHAPSFRIAPEGASPCSATWGGGGYELNRERGRTRLRALLVDAAADIASPLAHVKFMSSTSSAFRCRQLYHKLAAPRKCPTVPDRSGRLPSEGAYPSHGRIGRWRLHTGGRPQCITGRVAEAHEFIRKNAAARIGVPEVAAAVRVSQRMR